MSQSEDRTAFDWEARFVANDAPWERQSLHPALEDWVKAGLIRPGLSVLVPGCGRSEEPAALAQMGLHVTGIDLAPTATAWQRARFEHEGLEGVFITGDGLSWRPEAPFDLLYEQTFLCAIHPHHRPAYAQMAHDSLKPGGRLLALFMQKAERGGPPYGCDLDAMRTLFPDTQWIWPEPDAMTPYPHPGLNDKAELGAVLVRR